MVAAKIIFWLCLVLFVYTYFIYPLLLILLGLFLRRPINKRDITPPVSMIIAAHNEERNIRRKIKNSLELNYPKDKLEIIVASDCSTDNTDDIVREYEDERVTLVRLSVRGGKTAAQNLAVENATGAILVFSDAPTLYRPDAIRKLVRNYYDSTVGCVTGEVIYVNDDDSLVGKGGALYWRYESWLKRMESDIGSVLGAAGCIYSIRKSLYTPFDENYISDFISPLKLIVRSSSLDGDFLTPLKIYTKGIRSVMEPEAISIEQTSKSLAEELNMRSRVITRAISGLFYMKEILNPVRYPLYSFQLISHKIMRWLTPIFMMAIFIVNIFLLEQQFYQLCFATQLFVYAIGVLGYLCDKKKLPMLKAIYIPYFFCVTNLAVLFGIIKYLTGKRAKVWTPAR